MALQEIVVAAAIEKNDALASRRQIFAKRIDQRWRQRHRVGARITVRSSLSIGVFVGLCAPKMLAQIDYFDLGEFALVHAARKTQLPIAPAPRIGERLRRRRRGSEHDRTFAELPERNRQVARVVANSLLLLVGGVMFLVDDDQTEAVNRSEDDRARANHDARLPAQRTHPTAPSLGHVLRAVHDADERSKAGPKLPDDLVGERDFRHQHEHLASRLEHFAGELQVYLGLAARGHAPEQKGLEAPLAYRGYRGFDRRGLLPRKLERLRRRGVDPVSLIDV